VHRREPEYQTAAMRELTVLEALQLPKLAAMASTAHTIRGTHVAPDTLAPPAPNGRSVCPVHPATPAMVVLLLRLLLRALTQLDMLALPPVALRVTTVPTHIKVPRSFAPQTTTQARMQALARALPMVTWLIQAEQAKPNVRLVPTQPAWAMFIRPGTATHVPLASTVSPARNHNPVPPALTLLVAHQLQLAHSVPTSTRAL